MADETDTFDHACAASQPVAATRPPRWPMKQLLRQPRAHGLLGRSYEAAAMADETRRSCNLRSSRHGRSYEAAAMADETSAGEIK